MIVQEAITILIPILAWKIFIKRKLSDMGLTSIRTNYKELIVGLLFGAVSIAVVFAAILLSGHAEVASWTPHFSVTQILYLLIFTSVGFAEEILGRGYIMSVLRQTKSVPAILIISRETLINSSIYT